MGGIADRLAGGVISGGGNTFTFLQNSSDSHNLNITTTSDVVTDSGYDTYSESMSGTETYGPGGTVSGGSDSFTWAQTASDNLILTQDYGGTTLGIYTLYDMTVDDQIYQNFSDVGNDILGPSDSILGGGDTFTWGSSRDLVSTITVYTFTDTESSTDNFVLNKTIPSSMNGVATDSTSEGSSMTGATSTGPSGSTFGYTEMSQSTSQFDDGGNVTSGLVVTPITLSTTTSLALQIVLTGPIAATTTTTVGSSTTLTGGNDGANFTETDYAGEGSTAGTPVAALAGSSPDGSAEHQGTSPGGLDTSSGLLSALGGEGVHAMSFAGAEILPTANPTGTAFWLEESNQSGQTPTNWVSHPSGIGYSRGSSGIITSGSGSGSGSHSSTTGPPIPGNAPTMDSGTSDGGAGQELGRLGNFNAGGNENSNATQPGPTPRAQQVSMLMLPAGSPAATNLLLTNPGLQMPVNTLLFRPSTDGATVTTAGDGGAAQGGNEKNWLFQYLDSWGVKDWLDDLFGVTRPVGTPNPAETPQSPSGPAQMPDAEEWEKKNAENTPTGGSRSGAYFRYDGNPTAEKSQKAVDMITKDFPLYAAGVIIEVAATLSGPEELTAIRAAAAAKGLLVQAFKKNGKWILRFARDKAKKQLGDATEAEAQAALIEAQAALNAAKNEAAKQAATKKLVAKKMPKPGARGKLGATDVPSWAQGQVPNVGEQGKDFAKRLLDQKYGPGNYETGPASEFNKLKKWADRHFQDP